MSKRYSDFVVGKYEGERFFEQPWLPQFPEKIQIFDIGELDMVGAVYPEGSRQVWPISWLHKDGLEILEKRREKKCRVRLRESN